MKKLTLFLAALLLFVPGTVGAMLVEPGTVEISGASQIFSSSLKFKNGESVETNQFAIDLLGAYYLRVNLGAGVSMTYDRTEVEDDEETSLSLGPVVKYQHPLAERANVYGIGSAGLQKYEFADGSDADGWYGSLGAGLNFFLSSSVSIDALVKYTYSSLDASGEDITADGFLVGAGLSIYLR